MGREREMEGKKGAISDMHHVGIVHHTPHILVFLNIVKRNTDRRTPLKHSFCPSWLPCPCPTTSRKTLIEE